MPSYILRTIDPELWHQVKERASREGWPLRALIMALLRGYAEGAIALTRATAQDKP